MTVYCFYEEKNVIIIICVHPNFGHTDWLPIINLVFVIYILCAGIKLQLTATGDFKQEAIRLPHLYFPAYLVNNQTISHSATENEHEKCDSRDMNCKEGVG